MKKVTATKADIREIEQKVVEAFPEYTWLKSQLEPGAWEEWSNESSRPYVTNIEPKPLDKWQQEQFDRWVETQGKSAGTSFYGLWDVLLTIACLRGQIAPDLYIIDVSW